MIGQARWALAPYAPAAPFRLYPGPGDRPPIAVDDTATLRRAAQRGGDAEITVLTTAKVRPVLVIAEAGASFKDPAVLALRLVRFSKLDPAEQDATRRGLAPRLFHLRPERFPGLPEENAALVTDLVRIANSALDPGDAVGGLEAEELRVLHERIVRYYEFDLTLLARKMLEDRLRQRREATGEPSSGE